jgi:class 3 adenylate cyclase
VPHASRVQRAAPSDPKGEVDLPGRLGDLRRPRFVGRSADMTVLHNVMDMVEHNGSAVVTLHGAAGMGKSRLLQELIDHPGCSLDVAAVARCSVQPLGPYNDLMPLLREVLGEVGASDARARLHALGVDSGSPRTADELSGLQFTAFAEVSAGLLSALENRRGLLVVDDVHWASPALLRFVDFLVEEILTTAASERLLVVLASRPLPPEHPGIQLIGRLERSTRVHRLDLAPLEEAHAAEMIRLYAGDPSPAYLGLVRRSSNGNPLQIRAAVDVLKRRGVLTSVAAGDRRLQGRLQLPAVIDDPVAVWLDELPSDMRSLLGLCAVLGDEFTLSDIEALAEHDLAVLGGAGGRASERVAEDQLDAGLAAGVLGTDGDTLWFAHPQYRELIYATMPASRRRQLHGRCARRLRQLTGTAGSGPETAMSVGHHLLRAGGPDARPGDAEVFSAAGDAALAAAAWDDAASFYAEALRRITNVSSAPECLELWVKLGNAHYFNHDAVGATAGLRQAIEAARTVGDEEAWCNAVVPLMRVANTMHAASYQHPADVAPVEEFLRFATQARTRALALEVMAETYIGAGHVEAGDELSAEALRLARQAEDNSTLALCCYARSYADMSALRVRAAVGHGREALRFAGRADDWHVENAIRVRVSFATLGAGALDEADRLAETAVAAATPRHEYSVQALGNAVRCAVALLRGDQRRAEQLAELSAADTRRSGHAAAMYHIAPLLVFGHLQAGRPAEALTELGDWRELPRSMQRTFRNLAAVASGHPEDVDVDERDLHRRVTWMGAGVLVADIAVAVATNAPRLRLERAEQLLADMEAGGLTYTLSYPISLRRLHGDVLVALERFDEAIVSYEGAVVTNRAAGAHPELARSLLGLARAEATRSGGSVDEARRLATEAAHLADQLELGDVARSAAALGRADIDLPHSVASRGGGWTVILIADVVNSTQISQAHGDLAYHRLVSDHQELVGRCIARHDGHQFSEGGDSLFVWFSSTAQAVGAAVAIHDAVLLRDAPGPVLQVKVALAGGEPLFRGGRPFGLVLNRAARLLPFGQAGDILADEAVAASAATLGKRILLEPREVVELRGIGPLRVTALRAGPLLEAAESLPIDDSKDGGGESSS